MAMPRCRSIPLAMAFKPSMCRSGLGYGRHSLATGLQRFPSQRHGVLAGARDAAALFQRGPDRLRQAKGFRYRARTHSIMCCQVYLRRIPPRPPDSSMTTGCKSLRQPVSPFGKLTVLCPSCAGLGELSDVYRERESSCARRGPRPPAPDWGPAPPLYDPGGMEGQLDAAAHRTSGRTGMGCAPSTVSRCSGALC